MALITARRVSAFLAFLVVALVVIAPAIGQGTFKLKYRVLERDEGALSGRTHYWLRRNPRPTDLKGVPDAITRKAGFFVEKVGELPLLIAIESGDPPQLYADTDLDGDLADETAATVARKDDSTVYFEPLLIGAEGANRPPVQVSLAAYVRNGDVVYASVTRSGAHVGTATLGEKEYAVAVLDSSFDGDFDDSCSAAEGQLTRGRYDLFAVDLNGSGHFDTSLEIMPLPSMVKVDDSYYTVAVKPDGSSLTLKAVTPAMATLEPVSDQATLVVWSRAGVRTLAGSDAPWELPVGKYGLVNIALHAQDGDGNRWEVAGMLRGQGETFEIREGETTHLRSGPPLVAKTDVDAREGFVLIGLTIVGQAGETYFPGADKNGERQAAPRFRVLDEKGKELVSGAFSYG